MDEIFLNLLAKLQSLNIFKTIEIWNSQVERARTGKGQDFLTPAVYIEFKVVGDECLSLGFEGIEMDIRFHIVDIEYDAGYSNYDQNLQIFSYRDLLNKTFVDYAPLFCSPFLQKKEIQSYKHNNMYHYVSIYKTYFVDKSGHKKVDILKPTEVIWNTAQFKWDECMLNWNDLYFPSYHNNINI